MEKISFVSLSKIRKIILVSSFFVFLVIFSVVWRIIFAQDIPSLTTIPLAPTNLILGNTTLPPVELRWTDNSTNEDKFNIERKLSSASTWITLFQMLQANAHSYIDTTALLGMTYDYRIQACLLGTGCSDYVTLTGVLIPITSGGGSGGGLSCTSLNLTLNDGKISYTIGEYVNYTWTCSLGGTANNVYVRLQKPDSTSTSFNSTSNSSTQTNGFSTSNLAPGTYILKACFESSCATVNASQTFTISTTNGNTGTIPLAPTNLSLNGTPTIFYVSLHWNDNSNNEDKFNIERKLSSTSTWPTSPLTQITTINTTSYTDTSITAGMTYDYRVQACLSGTGCSDYVTLTSVSVPTTSNVNTNSGSSGGSSIPSAPTNLSLDVISIPKTISLQWTDNANNEDKFNIERKLSRTSTWSTLAQVGTNIIHYVDTTALSGMTYDYRVQACLPGTGCSDYVTLTGMSVVSDVNSDLINDTSINTTAKIPSTPTNLTLNKISTSSFISIYWTDNANNEDKFNIERKLSSTSTWTTLAQVGTNIIYFVDTKALPGMTYDYRVQACLSGTGCSDYAKLEKVLVSNTTSINNTTTNTLTTTITPIIPTPITSTTSTTTTTLIVPTTPTTSTTQTTQTNMVPKTNPLTPTTQNPILTINVFSSKVQDLGLVIEERKTVVNDTKEQLVKTINQSIANIIKNSETLGQKTNTAKINILRDKLLEKVNSSLETVTVINETDINNLKTEINKRISEIKLVAGENITIAQTNDTSSKDITNTLNTLSQTVNNQSETLKTQGGELLYKDSNKDGISDYDSVYVYNMNPTTPSPVSTYEGKSVNASEKILLGFDPTQSEIVKTNKEQPSESTITPVSTYKVKEVALTEKKEVVIKGQALPNSFITIYIYSTPIMVTVKTDSNGEWQYVLDKELENGDHTVYTATVNNSGNIIAKSSPYLFTKTAEAATLKDIPIAEASATTNQPTLLEGNNLNIAIVLMLVIGIIVLILMGIDYRKNKEKIKLDNKIEK